jgi:hypothetical protein
MENDGKAAAVLRGGERRQRLSENGATAGLLIHHPGLSPLLSSPRRRRRQSQ